MLNLCGEELFTWGNLVLFVVLALLIWVSLNFRLYMVFKLPSRKEKLRQQQRQQRLQKEGEKNQ